MGEGREALLRGVIAVVARSGLRKLTYRAVAAEAGVTHGLVAHHFGSRDAMLLEALKHSAGTSVTGAMLADAGEIDTFVDGLVSMIAADPERRAFEYELMLEARRQPELRPHAAELRELYRSAVRKGLARLGFTDDRMAPLVYACVDGLVWERLTATSEADFNAPVEELRSILHLTRAHNQKRGTQSR
jgi:AcrR family transcriptional regulator